MSRLEDLKSTRDGLKERMSATSSDQNYAVMGRLLVDVVKQIDELEGTSGGELTGLSEFERKLAEREGAGSSSARRSGGV